jgi:hypothetical protein
MPELDIYQYFGCCVDCSKGAAEVVKGLLSMADVFSRNRSVPGENLVVLFARVKAQ